MMVVDTDHHPLSLEDDGCLEDVCGFSYIHDSQLLQNLSGRSRGMV